MQSLLLAVVEVQRVGGDPWWRDLLGPALAALTAVAAAVIAARTANRRQQEQLSHDRVLQAEQLAYDREQRNRQYARDAVDEALIGTDDATKKMAEFAALITLGDEQRAIHRATAAAYNGPVGPDSAVTKLTDEMERLRQVSMSIHDALLEMVSHGLRMSLRLNAEHPVVLAHLGYRQALQRRQEFLDTVAIRSVTEDDRPTLERNEEATAEALEGFHVACREWLTAHRPSER